MQSHFFHLKNNAIVCKIIRSYANIMQNYTELCEFIHLYANIMQNYAKIYIFLKSHFFHSKKRIKIMHQKKNHNLV